MDNFFKKTIENKIDDSRRFENIQEELFDYELQYVEKLDKGELVESGEEINNNEFHVKFRDGLKTPFEKKLFRNTIIYHKLRDGYVKRFVEVDELAFKEWASGVFDEIDNVYNSNNERWKESTLEIIKKEIEKIGPVLEVAVKKIENELNKEENVGLIKFNIQNLNGLKEFGVEPGSPCMSLHFEDLSKQKNKFNEIKSIFSGESLSLLAVKMINDFPEAKAIIGRSWLIDSPIGKRIGFNIFKRYERVVNNNSFWGQFIDEDGKIKKEDMEKFLQTGKANYYPAEGFIRTEDFLRKYLPKENRGEIKLKDLSNDSKEFIKERKNILDNIKSNFFILSYEEIERLLKGSILAEFFNTKEGEELLAIVKKAKDQKIEKVEDIKGSRLGELNDKMMDYFKEKESKYIERKVLIN